MYINEENSTFFLKFSTCLCVRLFCKTWHAELKLKLNFSIKLTGKIVPTHWPHESMILRIHRTQLGVTRTTEQSSGWTPRDGATSQVFSGCESFHRCCKMPRHAKPWSEQSHRHKAGQRGRKLPHATESLEQKKIMHAHAASFKSITLQGLVRRLKSTDLVAMRCTWLRRTAQALIVSACCWNQAQTGIARCRVVQRNYLELIWNDVKTSAKEKWNKNVKTNKHYTSLSEYIEVYD